jgi:hypothetical protein
LTQRWFIGLAPCVASSPQGRTVISTALLARATGVLPLIRSIAFASCVPSPRRRGLEPAREAALPESGAAERWIAGCNGTVTRGQPAVAFPCAAVVKRAETFWRAIVMRVVICLLSIAFFAQAAPAPFPKAREKEVLFSTERVKQHLQDHHRFWHITSIETRGPREWRVVGIQGIPWTHDWHDRIILVRDNGKGDASHRLTLVDLNPSGQAKLR